MIAVLLPSTAEPELFLLRLLKVRISLELLPKSPFVTTGAALLELMPVTMGNATLLLTSSQQLAKTARMSILMQLLAEIR